MKILVTGSAGFIGGYVVEELLSAGHQVVGLDNLSKYGDIQKSYDRNPNFKFVKGDAKDIDLLKKLLSDCDQILMGAAIIGGISLFHEFAYDLLAEGYFITRDDLLPLRQTDPVLWGRLMTEEMLEHRPLDDARRRFINTTGDSVDTLRLKDILHFLEYDDANSRFRSRFQVRPEVKIVVVLANDTGQRYFTTALCGVDKHVEVPIRDHPLDSRSSALLDQFQEFWDIIE